MQRPGLSQNQCLPGHLIWLSGLGRQHAGYSCMGFFTFVSDAENDYAKPTVAFSSRRVQQLEHLKQVKRKDLHMVNGKPLFKWIGVDIYSPHKSHGPCFMYWDCALKKWVVGHTKPEMTHQNSDDTYPILLSGSLRNRQHNTQSFMPDRITEWFVHNNASLHSSMTRVDSVS